jgi:hypothetical protein
MNKERILAVADAIENESVPGLQFDMTVYRNSCGTAGCIAGWAFVMFADDGRRRWDEWGNYPRGEIFNTAKEVLGLCSGEAWQLFLPEDPVGENYDATAEEAVTVLRQLAETGVVDWSVAS